MSKRSTNTKERIIKATRNLLSSHGYGGISLDDVLTASGITKGAFYHYFKTKDHLVEETLQTAIDDYKQIVSSLPHSEYPLDQLGWFFMQLCQLNTSGQWTNCRLIIRLTLETSESPSELHRSLKEFWSWFYDTCKAWIIQSRQAKQLEHVPDVDTQTRLLLCLWAGTLALDKVILDLNDLPNLPNSLLQAIQFVSGSET